MHLLTRFYSNLYTLSTIFTVPDGVFDLGLLVKCFRAREDCGVLPLIASARCSIPVYKIIYVFATIQCNDFLFLVGVLIVAFIISCQWHLVCFLNNIIMLQLKRVIH